NLRHVPENLRPPQETPDPDDDPTREWRGWRREKTGKESYIVVASDQPFLPMPEKTTALEKKRSARGVADIIAIAIVAFAIANLLHEGAGHGGACVLTGGHAKVLSSVHFECDRDSRFIAAAGTLVNFITGFLCWLGRRFIKRASGNLQYFLW